MVPRLRATAVAAAVLLAVALGGCTSPPPLAVPSQPVPGTPRAPESTPSPSGSGCAYRTLAPGNEANVKDVGMPPTPVRTTGTATMTITTNLGVVVIAMDAAATPCAVASFAYLAGKKFFDGTSCHRLTRNTLSVLQCGDPSGTGLGGPRYQYSEEHLNAVYPGGSAPPSRPAASPLSYMCVPGDPDDFLDDGLCEPGLEPSPYSGGSPPVQAVYRRGLVAVARAQDPGTSGSQFFISYADNPLDAWYTPLGTVTRGMEVIDQVAAGGVVPATGSPADTDEGAPKLRLVLQQLTVAYA
jgi:peptidyl-prolyl cis-trans isomerase B (cyclophilin B)